MVDAVAKYQKYAEYKDSGVEWLGEIPSHWVTSRLKYYTNQIVDGAHFTPTYSDSGVPFLRVTDIHNDAIDFDNIKYIPEKEHEELIQRCKPEKGDLLLSKNGTIGVPKRITWDWEFSIFVSLCLIKFKKELKVEFAEYFFKSYEIREQIFGLIKKSTVINLHLDKIENFWFAFPRVDEQTLITNFLDHETAKIDSLIEKQQKLIELLKEKRQAVISHAVTQGLNPDVPMKDSGVEWLGQVPEHWTVKSYRHASKIYRGKFGHRPRNDPAFYDGDYPFIQTGDVARAYKYITSYSQTLNEKGKEVSQLFPKGTLMMAIAANIGDLAILGFEAYAPDSVVGFKPNKDIDLEFLRYSFMASLPALEQTSTQSTQANLNVERIGAVHGVFPSPDEQKRIVNYLDDMLNKYSVIEKEMDRAISLLQERRTALISSAVTGKIDVRNWQNLNKNNNNEANTEFGA